MAVSAAASNRSDLALVARLGSFIPAFRRLVDRENAAESTARSELAVRLRGTLAVLGAEMKAATERGDMIDLWAAAGLGRNEVRTSATLAWMLSPQGSHGWKGSALDALWDTIRAKSIAAGSQLPERVVNPTVLREASPFGSLDDRVDLLIFGDNALVAIEVKIDAVEGRSGSQSRDYLKSLRARGEATAIDHVAVVFVSEKAPGEKACVHLRWIDVGDALRRAANGMNDGVQRRLLADFAGHLARLH